MCMKPTAMGSSPQKLYVCGNDWSLREIEPSEGYLLNTESLHIGVKRSLYGRV